LEVSELHKCSSAIKKDYSTFGISCVKTLLEFQTIDVEHSTDIARLKKDAAAAATTHAHKGWSNPLQSNSDVVIIFNATLLTMESGNEEVDLIPDGLVVVRGGVIDHVGAIGSFVAPTSATVIDAAGGMLCFSISFAPAKQKIFKAT
jgi:hypothetical protein